MGDIAKCMVPGCERPAKVRGCCKQCYCIARSQILLGNTTFDELVASGLMLPPMPRGKRGRPRQISNPMRLAILAAKSKAAAGEANS